MTAAAFSSSSSSSSSSIVFLITGASRGLGKAIATVAGNYYADAQRNGNADLPVSKARFLLVARSSNGINDTKKEILLAAKKASSSLLSATPTSTTTSTITTTATTTSEDVLCRSMDLSDLDRLDSNIDLLLNDLDHLRSSREEQKHSSNDGSEKQQQQQHRLVFVNNAASLGHLGPSWKSPSLEDMRQTIDLNVTGSLWLSVRFARYVKELQQKQQQQHQHQHQRQHQHLQKNHQATIVNISSLAAISEDFAGMGIYSAGKAAREMYHALLAKDDDDGDDNATATNTTTAAHINSTDEQQQLLKILNYAPGPLETGMTKNLQESKGLHGTSLQSLFRQTTQLLDPEDSASKLIHLLDSNAFESGSHIDYYDLPDPIQDGSIH